MSGDFNKALEKLGRAPVPDPDVVERPDLMARLEAIEKRLNIPRRKEKPNA